MAKMRAVLSLLLLCASAAHAQKDPLQLYGEGRYAEAAHAIRKALENDKDDARMNYNLAATLWRLGEADEAETSAEKAATLADGMEALRDGILGNLRFEAALKKAGEQAKDQPRSKILEEALGLMVQARNHYQQGATRPEAGPALARNLERAIRKEEELRKQLEEQKKKEEKQKKKDKNNNENKDNNKDEDKDKENKKDQKQGKDEKDRNKKDQPRQQPQEPKPQKRPQLGKFDPNKELTQEQKKRLLQMLKRIEAQLRELQKQKKARRPKVKKDW